MSFLLGMLTMAIIHPFLVSFYNCVRLMWRLRQISKQFSGESRAAVKSSTGEWRED